MSKKAKKGRKVSPKRTSRKSRKRSKTKISTSRAGVRRKVVRSGTKRASLKKPRAQAPKRRAIKSTISFTVATGSPITAIAASSVVAKYNWKDRGKAKIGYMKGMALVFARVYCKLKAGVPAAVEMAKANTGVGKKDALAWYDPEFQALGMDNSKSGPDTLRHLFTLLLGLGMRESSGRYCEGRDQSASNTTAETAEAGLFQTSYNARNASPLLPALFADYSANPSGFVDVFKEGVVCKPKDWENFGTGPGRDFQELSKTCPAFAAEFAAVGLRNVRGHWGPIKNKHAEVLQISDTMFRDVQNLMDSQPQLCAAVG